MTVLSQLEKSVRDASLLLYGDAHAADTELETMRSKEVFRSLTFQDLSGSEAEATVTHVTSRVMSFSLLAG
jgi:hypothetical protein